MSLSEHEAEERLALLRRQREALDREIADLVLYLELGRRLNSGLPRPPASLDGQREEARPAPPTVPAPGPADHGDPDEPSVPSGPWGHRSGEIGRAAASPFRVAVSRGQEPAAPPAGSTPRRPPPVPRPVAFSEDPTGARQYGRALIEAACVVIAEAGRPLHAREIHDALIVRGFAIPGRDPVAALNTRLWKRSGEGGPLRRHGEAVYGLPGDDVAAS